MNNKALLKQMAILHADTYALYLKTQNYHWHVKGLGFYMLHKLFEEQYTGLAAAVDEIAERLVMLGTKAPATFSELNALKTLNDGDAHASGDTMLADLAADHSTLVTSIKTLIDAAQPLGDEGTLSLLGDRIVEHEKYHWMLDASTMQ